MSQVTKTAVVFGLFCTVYSVPSLAQFQTNVTITNPNTAPVTQSLSLSDLTASHAFAVGGSNPLLNGSYMGLNSGLTAAISLNGKTVNIASPMNSTAVTVVGLGTVKTFDTGNRVGSLQAATNYFLGGVNSFINSPNNPSNPAVGNPQSLAGRMVVSDFAIATGIGDFDQTGLPGGEPAAGAPIARTPNALTAGGEFTYSSAGGVNVEAITVPTSYSFYFPDPRYSLTVDAPVTYLRVGNANVGQGSLGTTFKFPVVNNWSLSVSGRGGIVGSEDLLLGNYAYSGSVGSQYLLFPGNYKVAVGNSVGAIQTSPFRVGTYTTGPSRLNVPFINGVSVEGSLPFTVFDKPTSFEAYVVDTYFAGQQIAIRHYDEIGLNVGTRRRPDNQNWDSARLGIAYTGGKSFQAVSLRLSYRF